MLKKKVFCANRKGYLQGIEIRFVVPAPFMLNTPFQRANILKIVFSNYLPYTLDAARSSGILKAKQKLGVTFNSDKVGSIDFTKFSKLSMCSAGAGRCWLVQWPGLPPRHCTWSVLKFL